MAGSDTLVTVEPPWVALNLVPVEGEALRATVLAVDFVVTLPKESSSEMVSGLMGVLDVGALNAVEMKATFVAVPPFTVSAWEPLVSVPDAAVIAGVPATVSA